MAVMVGGMVMGGGWRKMKGSSSGSEGVGKPLWRDEAAVVKG